MADVTEQAIVLLEETKLEALLLRELSENYKLQYGHIFPHIQTFREM